MQIISVVGSSGKTTFIQDISKNIACFSNVLISCSTKMRLAKINNYDYLIIKKQDFDKYNYYFLKNNKVIKKYKYNEQIPSNIDRLKNIYITENINQKLIKDDYVILKNRFNYISYKASKFIIKDIKIIKKFLKENISCKIFKRKFKIYYFLPNIDIDNKKFYHMKDEDLSYMSNYFNYILLESDGSKKKLLKYPKDYEPVILKDTSTTVAMLDISLIGKDISEDIIYNIKDFYKFIIKDSNKSKIDIQLMYELIKDEEALFKNALGERILCINKIKNETDYKNAKMLSDMLKDTNLKIIYKKYKNN